MPLGPRRAPASPESAATIIVAHTRATARPSTSRGCCRVACRTNSHASTNSVHCWKLEYAAAARNMANERVLSQAFAAMVSRDLSGRRDAASTSPSIRPATGHVRGPSAGVRALVARFRAVERSISRVKALKGRILAPNVVIQAASRPLSRPDRRAGREVGLLTLDLGTRRQAASDRARVAGKGSRDHG